MRTWPLCFLILSCTEPAPPPAPVSPCIEQRFEQAGFIVCRADRVEVRAGMRDFKTLQARLGPDADKIAFAMNAGMFDDAGAPIGLLIEEGREVRALNQRSGGGNFHLSPNGIFLVRRDGRSEIVATQRFTPANDILFATQSGPMLVIDGKLHPKFDADGSSRYVRNGVGIAPDGKPLFVITTDVVSFGKFARFFRDRLKTSQALYLDGSISSLWDPGNGRMDDFTALGPLVVAFRSAESVPDRAGPAKP